MAVTLVGAGTVVSNSALGGATGLALTPHASTLTDDLMICVMHRNDDIGSFDTITGWTLWAQESTATGQDMQSAIFYKKATSDSEGTATFTHSDSASEQWAGCILTFRGQDLVTPVDTAYVSGSHFIARTNKASPNVDAFQTINVTTTGATVVAFEAVSFDDITSDADPSGYTNAVRHYGGAQDHRQFQAWYKESVSSGNETPGAPAYTSNNTVAESHQYTIAIRPGSDPTITDVETDEDFNDKDTAVTITGTNFETPQGTGKVEISDNATYASGTKVSQTITSWGATSIDFTAVLSTLTPGALWLWVTNDTGDRNGTGFDVTVHRADAFQLGASANITAGGEATTYQLTPPAGKTGAADFDTGRMWDDENGTDSVDITADDYTELEWSIKSTANVEADATYDFRITKAGTVIDTYTATPKWTYTSAGESEEPGTGSLTLTGQQPTVTTTANHFVDVADGSLALAGKIHNVGEDIVEVPSTGTLALTGKEPALNLTENQFANPGAGAIALTGEQPTPLRTENHFVSPGDGSVSLTGQTPVRQVNHIISVPAGSLTITGEAPTALASIATEPAQDTLVLTGYAPERIINHIRGPPAESLALTGEVPTLAYSWTVFPDAGSLTLTGYIPTAGAFLLESPGTGSLTITGYEPTLEYSWSVFPDAGSLTLTGYLPNLEYSWTVNPDDGSLALTGYEPTLDLEANQFADPGTGSLTLTGYTPSLEYSWTVFPGVGSLSITGYAPSAEFSWTVFPDTGSLSLTGLAPTIAKSETVEPDAGSLTLTGYLSYNYGGPGLRLTGFEPILAIESTQPVVEPDKGSLTLTGYSVTLVYDWVVYPGVGSLALTGEMPSISRTQSTAPGTDGLNLTGYAPSLRYDWVASPDKGSLALTGYSVTLKGDLIVLPDAGSLTLTGQSLSASGTQSASPDAGSLTLTGSAPNLVYDWVVNPGKDSLVLTGYEPTVLTALGDQVVYPGRGSLNLTGLLEYNYGGPGFRLIGYEPVPVNTSTPPPLVPYNVLTLTGYEPTSDTEAFGAEVPGTGSLSLTGHSPALEIFIANLDASLELTGYEPTYSFDTVLEEAPGAGSLTLTGYEPIAYSGEIVESPGAGSLALTGYAPTLIAGHYAFPDAYNLTLTGQDVTFAFGFDWVDNPGKGSLSLSTTTPIADVGLSIIVDKTALALTGSAPTTDITKIRDPDAGGLTLTPKQPIANVGLSVIVDKGALTLSGKTPLSIVSITNGELTLTGHGPTSINSGDAVEQPSGGYEFWEEFARELEKKKKAKRDRIEARRKAKAIQDELIRKLALEERIIEEDEARKAELDRVVSLVEEGRDAILQLDDDKLTAIMDDAIARRTFSAMERLERVLTQQYEDEIFLMLAAQIIINQ